MKSKAVLGGVEARETSYLDHLVSLHTGPVKLNPGAQIKLRFLTVALLFRLGFLNDITFPMLAAYSASVLVKRCATHAYARHRRAMLASDLVPAVEVVARELFDE